MITFATTAELRDALAARAGMWAEEARLEHGFGRNPDPLEDLITLYARTGRDEFAIFRSDLDLPTIEVVHYRVDISLNPLVRASWTIPASDEARNVEDLAECVAASIERHMERRVVD